MASLALVFDLIARDKASREIDRVGESAKDADRKVGSLSGALRGGLAAAAGAAAAAGIGSLFAGFVQGAREAASVTRVTENAIRATGGAAGVTSSQVVDLAESLSLKSGIDDELIQRGANLILTFKGVRNEAGEGANIFDRATAAAADLSAAGFGSVESASLQLGKALNDPLKGIAALGRAGVTFTEQQKEQIKALVESGDILGAQKVILAEVEGQVGGAAEAAADPISRLQSSARVLAGELEGPVLGAVDSLVRGLTGSAVPAVQGFLDDFRAGEGVAGRFRGVLAGVGGFLRDDVGPVLADVGRVVRDDVAPPVGDLAGFLQRNRDVLVPLVAVVAGAVATFQLVTGAIAAVKVVTALLTVEQLKLNLAMLANPIGIVVAILAALVAAIVIAYQRNERFREIVQGAWQGIQDAVRVAWEDYIRPAFTAISEFITGTLVPVIQDLWSKYVKPVFEGIGAVIKFMWDNVVGPVLGLWWAYITNVLIPVIRFLWDNVVKPVFNGIGTIIKFAWDKVINPIFKAWWAYINTVLIPVIKFLWDNVVKPVFKAIGDGIKTAWDKVIKPALTGFRDIVNTVREKVENAEETWDKFLGLLKGFKLPGWVQDLVDAAKQFAKGVEGGFLGALRALGDAPGGMRGTRIGGRQAQGYAGTALARVRGVLPAGLVISSTYRSPAHNARVGGSPTSLHMDASNPAVDIAGPTHLLDRFAETLRGMGGWRQLLWRVSGHYDHIHVAHRGGVVSSSWPTLPGLAADERPAILQTGETVVPRGGAGGDTYVIESVVLSESETAVELREFFRSLKSRARLAGV